MSILKRLKQMASLIINGITYNCTDNSIIINQQGLHVGGDLIGISNLTNKDNKITIEIIDGQLLNLTTDMNVICKNITGNVEANGNVTSDTINGDVMAGGNVTSCDINGACRAGGNIIKKH